MDALQVHVYPKNGSPYRALLVNTLCWIPTVVAVSFSEIYLGGSWTINALALFVGFVWMVAVISVFAGKYISLSREQAIEWAKDGAPADVRSWKDKQ